MNNQKKIYQILNNSNLINNFFISNKKHFINRNLRKSQIPSLRYNQSRQLKHCQEFITKKYKIKNKSRFRRELNRFL